MATYRKISGVNVKSYSTDPDRTYPSGMEGKLYYNSSDGQFKFVGLGAGAWATGADQNTGKQQSGSVGTSTAALAIGGYNDPPGILAICEQYNGSSWTEVADLNAARTGVSGGDTAQESIGTAYVSLSGAEAFEIQHKCTTDRSLGFGAGQDSLDSATVSIYTIVKIIKIA